MPRQKRTHFRNIQYAAARAAGLESIDRTLDLGNGMILVTCKAETRIADLISRMLAAVVANNGRDSAEHEWVSIDAEGEPVCAHLRRTCEFEMSS